MATVCRPRQQPTEWTKLLVQSNVIITVLFAPVAPWWFTAVGVLVALITLRPTRWILAYAGLALIRAYVVRRTRPWREDLGPAGSITDPNAPWRQWLDTRCHTCGS